MLSHYVLVCVWEDIWTNVSWMAKVSEWVLIEYQLRTNPLRYSHPTSTSFSLHVTFVCGSMCFCKLKAKKYNWTYHKWEKIGIQISNVYGWEWYSSKIVCLCISRCYIRCYNQDNVAKFIKILFIETEEEKTLNRFKDLIHDEWPRVENITLGPKCSDVKLNCIISFGAYFCY